MKKESYLLIDDDEVFRERLANLFRRHGSDVSLASSGKEAMSCKEKITRVVLDLRMPGETGVSLIQPIKAHFSGVKIVILTGFGSIPLAIECVRLGADNFLTKPVSFKELLNAFDDTTGSTSAGESLEVPSLNDVEWEHISRVVKEFDGNLSRAAKALGVHRRSLQRKLQKFS